MRGVIRTLFGGWVDVGNIPNITGMYTFFVTKDFVSFTMKALPPKKPAVFIELVALVSALF
ncbi:MAG: hypothetical protein Q8J60_08995, partial [Thiobacillus sp.]|nr:hypothetical protein [Thiobacillus sp.]